MFERFNDSARRAVVLAQEEARVGNRNYIGPEHILTGLLVEGEGIAAKVLADLGVDVLDLRAYVDGIGTVTLSPSGHIPFTAQCKKALELALRDALQLGHNYVGTEHLLLGLTSDDLIDWAWLGLEAQTVRDAVIKTLVHQSPQAATTTATFATSAVGKITRSVVVRMDEALYRALQRDAEANERTISQTVRHKLRELLQS